MMSKIKPEGICSKEGSVYSVLIRLMGLTNNQQYYIFKLTIVATNKTESALSNEVWLLRLIKAPATPYLA